MDSFSLVNILENEKIDSCCFLCTVDFKSLYTNIPVEYTIELMKELVFENKDVISNTDFIIDLLEVVLKNSLMEFHNKYFDKCLALLWELMLVPSLRIYTFQNWKTSKRKNQARSQNGMANIVQAIH